LVLLDVYSAGEHPIPGITSEELANDIRNAGHKNVHYYRSMQEAIEFLLQEARPGDAIMTIGAGNVSRASNEFMVLLGSEIRVDDKVKDAP
jgi:UDP-N-acetylmuramate--alanine ligase